MRRKSKKPDALPDALTDMLTVVYLLLYADDILAWIADMNPGVVQAWKREFRRGEDDRV